jgi:hypothetical protein
MYSDQNHTAGGAGHIPRNKARLIGPKRPSKLREICKQETPPPHVSSLAEPDKGYYACSRFTRVLWTQGKTEASDSCY